MNPDAVGAKVRQALVDRLEHRSTSPVVIAFSGGGDSLALLLEAKHWSDKFGRRLIALTVDHGLQPAAAEWAAWSSALALRLGVDHQTLVWRGAKPTSGLLNAARLGLGHRLIANAARQAGARVILMGHTADDCLEAAIMREQGVRVSTPRLWSPSPVWPEGRGLFIMRPLLRERRAAIRAMLQGAGRNLD